MVKHSERPARIDLLLLGRQITKKKYIQYVPSLGRLILMAETEKCRNAAAIVAWVNTLNDSEL